MYLWWHFRLVKTQNELASSPVSHSITTTSPATEILDLIGTRLEGLERWPQQNTRDDRKRQAVFIVE